MPMHYFSISEAKQVALEMAEPQIKNIMDKTDRHNLFVSISEEVGANDRDSGFILKHLHNALDIK